MFHIWDRYRVTFHIWDLLGPPPPPTILGYLPDPHETSIFGPAGLRYLILGVPAELLTQERNPPEARKL